MLVLREHSAFPTSVDKDAMYSSMFRQPRGLHPAMREHSFAVLQIGAPLERLALQAEYVALQKLGPHPNLVRLLGPAGLPNSRGGVEVVAIALEVANEGDLWKMGE